MRCFKLCLAFALPAFLISGCATPEAGTAPAQARSKPTVPTSDAPMMMPPTVGHSLAITHPSPPIDPKYRQANLGLFNLLKICVSRTGAVTDVSIVLPSDREFDNACLKTISTWRFKPMQDGGRDVPFCYVQKNVLRAAVKDDANDFKPNPEYPKARLLRLTSSRPCNPYVTYRQTISDLRTFIRALNWSAREQEGACVVSFTVKHEVVAKEGKPHTFSIEKVLPVPEDAGGLEILARQETTDASGLVVYETRWTSAAESEAAQKSPRVVSSIEGNQLSEVRVAPQSPTSLIDPSTDAVTDARVCVSVEGQPARVTLVKRSDPAFDLAVIDALWKWRWRPMRNGDEAVPFCYDVRFRLKGLASSGN